MTVEEEQVFRGIWKCIVESVSDYASQMDKEENEIDSKSMILIDLLNRDEGTDISVVPHNYSEELTLKLEKAIADIDWMNCGKGIESDLFGLMN